jgi:hypothetical protein
MANTISADDEDWDDFNRSQHIKRASVAASALKPHKDLILNAREGALTHSFLAQLFNTNMNFFFLSF